MKRVRITTALALALLTMVAPALAGAQCTKDTDCKGDRICEQGVCVNPAPASPVVASPAPAAAVVPPVDGGLPVPPAPVSDGGASSMSAVPLVPSPAVTPPPAVPAVSPPAVGAPAPPPAQASPGPLVHETVLALQGRVDGDYGFDAAIGGGGIMVGGAAGATTWFAGSQVGLLYMGEVEVGALFAQGQTAFATSLSLDVGGAVLIEGDHRTGTQVSLGWAPRWLINASGGDALSPLGLEADLKWREIVVPVWLLRTTDQTTFLGLGVGYSFR